MKEVRRIYYPGQEQRYSPHDLRVRRGGKKKNNSERSIDEAPSFAGCNRTYFGEAGRTYDLELHRPKEDKIPFICHLTFTAGGGEFGDLVQVIKNRSGTPDS
jgi:hypothetical protein